MKVLNSNVSSPSAEDLFKFTNGIEIDKLLYKQEIQAQKVWLNQLAKVNVVSSSEKADLKKALEEISDLMNCGDFDWRISDEDIHMNIERALTEKCGALGKLVHTGRSRNDLIATTLRLYVSDVIDNIAVDLEELKLSIKSKATEWIDVIVPGLTHLQFGQPIRLGHMFSSHGVGLKRDYERLMDSKEECLSNCPLGAAAFAGTHLDVDLRELAQELGFKKPLNHSYDAVGDRDFILDTLNSFALLATRLSRFCEETMYWTSTPIGVLKLPNQYSTGSSIMPNKRNPDVLELVRAKMSRVINLSSEGMNLVRTVVPSYGTDLHELKKTFVMAQRELSASLKILVPFVNGLSCDQKEMESLLNRGHILATEVANYFSENGMTFRDSYLKTAELVSEAEKHGAQVHQIANTSLNVDFSYESAVEKRSNLGGTSRQSAMNSIKSL